MSAVVLAQDASHRLGEYGTDWTLQRDELVRHIDKSAQTLKSMIDTKQTNLIKDIDAQFTNRRRKVDDLRTSTLTQISDLESLMRRFGHSKNEGSFIKVIQETENLDMVLEDLAYFWVDYESSICSVKHPLPPYRSFLNWRVTQFFDDDSTEEEKDDDSGDDDDVSRSWKDTKNDINEIVSVLMTADHGLPGFEPGSETGEDQMRQLRHHLDELFVGFGKTERELENARQRISTLTASLQETQELLEDQRRLQATDLGGNRSESLEYLFGEIDRILRIQDSEADARRQAARNIGSVAVNMAFIGNSGVGKSSLINAIRGLTADDIGAAAVGVNETTIEVTAYTHPDNHLLKFWDLPGVGTDQFPRSEYLLKTRIERYDIFVIVSATRFTENDSWLVRQVAERGKKFVFVRTKVDEDVKKHRRSHPRSHDPATVIDEIRDSTVEHLNRAGHGEADVYLLDSYATHKYDFSLLLDRLLSQLAEAKTTAASRRCVVS